MKIEQDKVADENLQMARECLRAEKWTNRVGQGEGDQTEPKVSQGIEK